MKVSDILKACFIRLGSSETEADAMLAFISSLAKSQTDFDRWNIELPPPVVASLTKGINAPDGDETAKGIIGDFQKHIVQHFNISDREITAHLKSIINN
jgi:hypothetical protein